MQDLTQIKYIQSVDELTDLYRAPSAAATDKVASEITPLYRDWIMASRFCVLATHAQGRVDISPRGDDGPVVDVLDAQHLALPD
jgi:predicted pyridoxine 5'-phosphate oxidase superfamily flavin-nucleotide-binding protein